ncbi:MAG TPA: hypothetical protein VFO70_08665, partial [Chitinophagaceae bacterium]|nr:hypothetical protein [Chitinophagaceae bacterium]
IVYTSFPVKNITWNQVNNVILKDGLLTLDQKNNRILQVEIRNSDPDIDEKDFNEFCSRQLKFIPGVV